jgi:hypothetical protein
LVSQQEGGGEIVQGEDQEPEEAIDDVQPDEDILHHHDRVLPVVPQPIQREET